MELMCWVLAIAPTGAQREMFLEGVVSLISSLVVGIRLGFVLRFVSSEV